MSFIDKFIHWASVCLTQNDEAKSFLIGRGSSEYQWVRHSIGFVGGDFEPDPQEDPGHNQSCSDRTMKHVWCDTCRYRSWSSTWEGEDGDKTQIIGRKISNSIVYPLTSYSNAFVGFQVRKISEKSFDTFLCTKRPEGYFFGVGANVHNIFATGELALSEGPSDQLVIERLVHPNALSITTNVPNSAQFKFIRRFAKRVYLYLDLDQAGRDGTRSIIDRLGSDIDVIDVKYPRMENVKDPNDFWKKVGDEKFARHFKNEMRMR